MGRRRANSLVRPCTQAAPSPKKSCGMLLDVNHLSTYRGLSGIDSALFVYFAVSLAVTARADRRWTEGIGAMSLLTAFAGKLAFEAATNSPLFVDASESSFAVVPLAHVLGGITGTAFAMCAGWRSLIEAVRSFLDPAPLRAVPAIIKRSS